MLVLCTNAIRCEVTKYVNNVTVYDLYHNLFIIAIAAVCEDDLPRNVYNIIRRPVTSCPYCEAPIFTMGYPMLFDGQIRLYSLYKLCVCCSPRCVKLASLLVNLPLVYPRSCEQNLAVVLVEEPA